MDLVAHLFQDGRGAQRGEGARRHNVLLRDTSATGGLQGVEQFLPVSLQSRVVRLSEIEIVAEAREPVARLDRLAGCIVDALRYDQGVAGVLVEQLVGLDV
jgi:hypothetical protein